MEVETNVDNLFTEHEEPEDSDESGDDETSQDGQHKINFGLTRKCVFNKLKSFHSVTSMPPDAMHDLMEGVLAQDLLGIIRILIDKKWFSLIDYNKALRSMKYSSQESSNKPQDVPSSPRIKKLPGKAISQWVHMRVFSIILYYKGWVVDSEDPVLLLALKLEDVTNRLCAEEFRIHDIETLEIVILEYLDMRKKVYEHYSVIGRPKPKHHFLTHYHSSVRNFGPPLSYWTGRYESKHRVAKSTAEASKNFINISHTISNRQQMRSCSTYYHGMFTCVKFKLPADIKTINEMTDSESETMKQFTNSPKDLFCSEIEFKCRKYKIGDVVVLNRNDLTRMEVGLIKAFLVKKESVFVIGRRYNVEQNALNVFESKDLDSALFATDMENLQDSYPLFKRGTELKFILKQHHHVSFSYN